MERINVHIVDEQLENEKTFLFIKIFFIYILLPFLVFGFVLIKMENFFLASVLGIVIFLIILLRKKIFNKRKGKPYWIGIGIIVLLLFLGYYSPIISQQLAGKEQLDNSVKNAVNLDMVNYGMKKTPEIDNFCLSKCGGNELIDADMFEATSIIRCICSNIPTLVYDLNTKIQISYEESIARNEYYDKNKK